MLTRFLGILRESTTSYQAFAVPTRIGSGLGRSSTGTSFASVTCVDTDQQSIRESNPSVRGLDLSSFLLIPSTSPLPPVFGLALIFILVQRITRYPLLLRQILQYTSPDQDFPAVQNALNEAENITGAINESVRDAEGDERLRMLSEDLWIGGEG